MCSRLSRLGSRFTPLWAALAAFVGAMAILGRAFRSGLVLASPDFSVYQIPFWKGRLLIELFGENCSIPTYDTLLALALPTDVYTDITYVAAAAATAFAAALFLRRRRCTAFGAAFGGLALAFSGYHFTLFSAGHHGYVVMIPHALLLLAAIDGMISEARWPWAVIGAVASMGALRNQPDVFVLCCLMFAPYALVRAVWCWRGAPTDGRARLGRRWVGVVAAFLGVVLLFGGRAMHYTATTIVAGREQQIADAGGANNAGDADMVKAASPDGDAAAAESDDAAAVERRWDFATSWSLPSSEFPELVCANLRGYDSGNPRGPYWGSLGRDVHYAENGGRGFVNFRQHTLYLGALTLAFALFAVVSGMRSSREISFWTAAAVVTLLLAMGRYTPLYRLFYGLPGMSGIRGPVKFLHLTEIALALLSGFGVSRFEEMLRAAERPRAMRRAALCVAFVAVASALALLAATLFDPNGIDPVLAAFGVTGREASVLRAILLGVRAKTLLVTAAVFAVGGAGLLFAALGGRRSRSLAAVALPAALCVVLVLDMGRAAAPYVNPIDIHLFDRPNVIVNGLRGAGQQDGSTWAGVVPGITDNPVFRNSFERNGVGAADPSPGESPSAHSMRVVQRFRAEPTPFRRWQFMGARLVFISPEDYAALPPSTPEFAKLGLFTFDRGTVARAGSGSGGARFGVLSLRRWTPGAAVYPVWEFAPDAESAWARLTGPGFDPARTIVLEDGPACTAGPGADAAAVPVTEPVDMVSSRGKRMVFETADDSPAGMLFVRMPFLDRDMRARVDGKASPLYVANRFSRAIPVPAGRHRVEVYLPMNAGAMVSVAVTFVLLVLAIAVLLRRRPCAS